ncbi:2288_t:CDS:2 [Cetraspora pellucida]|uniref:2288_t:CDS:1 n=1 Tax=Cetraspora pellucida TaxID=1433469 RepID=A0ACA9NVV6_9GLOM|nr:2288_t:CDS:2 [Cetraspora pellucida]
MDINSLIISTELSQSDHEQSDIEDCYETSDDYETTDDKRSSNRLVVSEEHALKKKRNHGMNSKTILEKQTELANHLDVLEILIGGFITFGDAPPAKQVAQELFLQKFTNETKFSYSKLTSNQSKRLNDELSARSKWKIDQECLCIRSSVCEVYTDQIGRICAKCILLTKDQVFKNALSKPIPKPENRHYTPKIYFKNNPLLKFLKNLDIKEL